jgi:hypothetical protein
MFQYYLVLFLLIIEVFILSILLLPLPDYIINTILRILQKIRYPIRIIFVSLLFFTIDQGMEMKAEETKDNKVSETPGSFNIQISQKTKKFRSERNFYLVSFTFCLLLIILRLEVILRKSLEMKEELKTLKVKIS